MDVRTKFRISRRYLLLTSLLVVVLVSSLFVCVFMTNNFSVASLENVVHVKNEVELKNAINNTPNGGSIIIVIDNDIVLVNYYEHNHTYNYQTSTLIIPANKDVTLTSNRVNGFYKLIGAVDMPTILVGSGGTLRLDGVIVTHKSGVSGCGVYVMHSGMFYMYSGEISGNTANKRTFSGGGVIISGGTFVMSGGKISGNVADKDGGGVDNYGSFVMSGGEISGNTAGSSGGGVHLFYPSNFTMSGGTISDNIANFGGGVHVAHGGFTLSGGEISGNTAVKHGGGVYNAGPHPFVMLGGEIFGNSAENGGGIYHTYDVFTMSDGKIMGNTATSSGGGVYSIQGFNRQGGVISDNTAIHGKDVYVFGDSNSGSSNSGGSGGSGGSSNGNGGSSGGNGGLSVGDGFSLMDVVFVCVGVALGVIGVVVAVLLFTFKKELKHKKEKTV